MKNSICLLMNKPYGYVCSTCSDRRHTIYELLTKENCINSELFPETLAGVNPVGRLDAETTGLILLTNDGMLNHNLTIPETHIPKTYYVELEKTVTEDQQKIYTEKAENGLLLPAEKKAAEYFASGAKISWITQNSCKITVTEGKFHQVRRTFLALGNKVTALQRQQIGKLELDEDMKPGSYRVLTENQLKDLYSFAKL